MTPSSIDRLPADQRDLISSWRADGRTIAEILDQLHALGARCSRSALARHIKEVDAARPEALAVQILTLSGAVSRLSVEIAALRRSLRAGRGTRSKP